jgi:glycosyltransferase involved in cell wall biosynthesis
MRVFVAGTSLLPSYGGPAFSVSRLAIALTDAGAEVGLWAPDQSAGSTTLLPVKSPVQRLSGTEAEALDRFGKADILHDNGIWLPHNHRLAGLAKVRGIPRIVSTRGMLEPWARRHKQFKKHLAWHLYQRRDLRLACCHHATAEAEADNLSKLRLGVPIVTVPNGVDVPEEQPPIANGKVEQATSERLRTVLFLGRIYPVKGLPMLIEAWARVRPKGWALRITGPDEAGHRKFVEKAVLAAGLGEVISFTGPIEPRMKKSAFFDAELLVLPSHSESFGVVVAEALAHGLPVLTTTRTPWSILARRECGWWVEATVDGISEGLRQATDLEPEARRAMGAKGRALAIEQFGWECVAERILAMYRLILGKASDSTSIITSPNLCLLDHETPVL